MDHPTPPPSLPEQIRKALSMEAGKERDDIILEINKALGKKERLQAEMIVQARSALFPEGSPEATPSPKVLQAATLRQRMGELFKQEATYHTRRTTDPFSVDKSSPNSKLLSAGLWTDTEFRKGLFQGLAERFNDKGGYEPLSQGSNWHWAEMLRLLKETLPTKPHQEQAAIAAQALVLHEKGRPFSPPEDSSILNSNLAQAIAQTAFTRELRQVARAWLQAWPGESMWVTLERENLETLMKIGNLPLEDLAKDILEAYLRVLTDLNSVERSSTEGLFYMLYCAENEELRASIKSEKNRIVQALRQLASQNPLLLNKLYYLTAALDLEEDSDFKVEIGAGILDCLNRGTLIQRRGDLQGGEYQWVLGKNDLKGIEDFLQREGLQEAVLTEKIAALRKNPAITFEGTRYRPS